MIALLYHENKTSCNITNCRNGQQWFGLVQTAGKSALFLKSDLYNRLSVRLFASDWISFVCPDITNLSAWLMDNMSVFDALGMRTVW